MSQMDILLSTPRKVSRDYDEKTEENVSGDESFELPTKKQKNDVGSPSAYLKDYNKIYDGVKSKRNVFQVNIRNYFNLQSFTAPFLYFKVNCGKLSRTLDTEFINDVIAVSTTTGASVYIDGETELPLFFINRSAFNEKEMACLDANGENKRKAQTRIRLHIRTLENKKERKFPFVFCNGQVYKLFLENGRRKVHNRHYTFPFKDFDQLEPISHNISYVPKGCSIRGNTKATPIKTTPCSPYPAKTSNPDELIADIFEQETPEEIKSYFCNVTVENAPLPPPKYLQSRQKQKLTHYRQNIMREALLSTADYDYLNDLFAEELKNGDFPSLLNDDELSKLENDL